ncbi:MAG: F0F1 ATP synthase subunit delta [Alphaproteobacteria bacterium]
MGFDLVTFVAQIVNLFVLVWLLKRFLYRPILEVIEKRQQEIRNKIQNAEEMRLEAEKERKKWEAEKAAYESEHQKELSQIAQELDDKRKKGLEEIKSSLQRLRLKMQNDLSAEMTAFHSEIGDFIAKDFMHLSEQALKELSSCCPLDQAANLFLKNLEELNKKEIKKINTILKNQRVIIVNSSETLSKKQIQEITKSIQKVFVLSPKCKINFQVVPELVLGLEMRVGDVSVDWSLKSYLDTLNANLDATLANLMSEK